MNTVTNVGCFYYCRILQTLTRSKKEPLCTCGHDAVQCHWVVMGILTAKSLNKPHSGCKPLLASELKRSETIKVVMVDNQHRCRRTYSLL